MANTTLLDIINSYGCMSNFSEMQAFFSNNANVNGIQDAINKYGTPVPNRASYHTGLGVFGSWHDFCDWQNIGKFYQFAKLSVQYPTLTNPSTDCSKVAGSITALNAQLANVNNVTKDPNVKTALTDAINAKIADYNSFNTTSSCGSITQTLNSASLKTLGTYALIGLAGIYAISFAIRIAKK